MEQAIQTVVGVFLSSAKGKESVSGSDFKKLVKSKLQNIMSGADSSSEVKEMCKGLDEDKDGKVSFQEYLKLVGYLASSMSDRKTGKEAPAEAEQQAK